MPTQHLYTRPLPAALAALNEIASDLRWTWSHASDALWQHMDPETWALTRNPYTVLQNLAQSRLEQLAHDKGFLKQLHALEMARLDYHNDTGWYGACYTEQPISGIAYFSLEFGLGEALPLYAGGLGILAGDYLKAVSDLGVPVVGIGLLYQQGYFRQTLDEQGWQQAVYTYNDPTNLPVSPVYTDEGLWLHIPVELPGRVVRFRIWQAQVGRVTLYLLDSNDPCNTPTDRGITGQLYGGGQEMRLVQEVALGMGGWRLIEALGLPVDLCHLNEGHAAFVTLERAYHYMQRHGLDFWQALWVTRAGNIFTTHTPVPAGFDTFERELILKYGQLFAARAGVDVHALAALGRVNGDDHGLPFNMAYLAMRTCGFTNGVSRLHGEVSRRIFQPLFPHWPTGEVPVTHVTNGVHMPSWDSVWADQLWTTAAGKGRWLGDLHELADAIAAVDDATLWEFIGRQRAELVQYARQRLVYQTGQRAESHQTVSDCARVLDPNALTLGFARRFAEYKRPNLLLQDPERLIRLLTNPERPVQLIVAGKAHPRDNIGKGILQQWANFVKRPEVRQHVVLLEDYDIAQAQELVKGVDVWINNPRRPWEACGTSGMKVLANGGLNLSELDGWWAEAYQPDVGWALGDGEDQHDDGHDHDDGTQLYDILEHDVVPAFYQRDERGIPTQWVERVRASMSRLTPQFSTNRMVRDYVETLYLPAAQRFQQRDRQPAQAGAELTAWQQGLQRHWQELHWGNIWSQPQADGLVFEAHVYLGEIPPDAIAVQVYADGEFTPVAMDRVAAIPGAINGYHYRATVTNTRPASDFTLRIVPNHPMAIVPAELNLIHWQPR